MVRRSRGRPRLLRSGDQIASDVAQHLAEALAEEPNPDEEAIGNLLDRIGTPEEIAAALDEASEDERNRQPYREPTPQPQPPALLRPDTA